VEKTPAISIYYAGCEKQGRKLAYKVGILSNKQAICFRLEGIAEKP
jgi:hypothetical protein